MNANRNYPVSQDLGLTPIKRMMSKTVMVAGPDTTLERAMQMMINHKISGLAVTDATNKVLGVFSEWDAILQGAVKPLESPLQYHGPAVTAHQDSLFRDVLAILIKSKVKRVLIVDDNDRLVGLMSRSDVMKAIYNDFEKNKDNG
ncbi:MAG: CBS domain-containing protein [Proteobacteria bacterium]|nr:CBS domain-containing protein [Pseudomonadota bacterium]